MCSCILIKLVMDCWLRSGPAVALPLVLRMLQKALAHPADAIKARAFDLLYNLSVHAAMLMESVDQQQQQQQQQQQHGAQGLGYHHHHQHPHQPPFSPREPGGGGGGGGGAYVGGASPRGGGAQQPLSPRVRSRRRCR
jgi:hypothetical protein